MPPAKPESGAVPDPRLLIVGYGTMAAAMVEGWLAAGIAPSDLLIYNPRAKPVPRGVAFITELPDCAHRRILLAFKPQMLAEVAPGLACCVGPESVILSVLAGVELATLQRQAPGAGGYVRFMPNLAAAIGKSPNALIATGLDGEQQDAVTRLAQMLGTAEWVEDEALFDLVTALAGSGPGLVYRFIDALAKGATELGLDRARADRLAVTMVEGAAMLAATSPHDPATLAARVASKGGMTQAGLDVLDAEGALNRLIVETLCAARDRGRILGQAGSRS
jgi:pyrroline-5-carboxylate reductase